MKKTFILLCSLLFLFIKTKAQNNLPPVYEIKSDTAFEQDLDSAYWQVLEDKTGTLKIDEVSNQPLAGKFQGITAKIKSLDTSIHTYWFRYRLKNATDKEINIALDSRADQSDFYVFQGSDKPKHFVTGNTYPRNKKDGFKEGNYIPLVLKPQEEVIIYYRIFNDKAGIPKDFVIDFVNTEKELQAEYKILNGERNDYYNIYSLYTAFIIGILFLASFFNLFFFLIAREKVYLYFSVFLFFLGLNNFYDIIHTYFLFEYSFLSRYLEYLTYDWIFILFFLIQFFRYFFQTFSSRRHWDKVLIGISFITVLLFITVNGAINQFFLLVRFPAFCSILITLILYRKKSESNPYNKLMITGALPYICLYIIRAVLALMVIILKNKFVLITNQFFMQWFRPIEIFALSWFILFFSWILFKRYDKQKKEIAQQALDKERFAKEKEIERSELIEQQKAGLEEQVTKRTAELKQSLEELKSTQSQLIQSEKMASLGELTAGIAHEIQNPLNFVNNFSEVNKELVDELQAELKSGNTEEAIAISNDIKDNEEKINYHGKRAGDIVKGMLQHSRSSTGVKEPTDINALADEYLRLSYHGLRAKEKSFNANFKTDFDESIGKINIIPQDIGRVILNLLTNAFYVVNEKKKLNIKGYEPTVSISTKKVNGKVEIKVSDNGNGIPQKVIDKIFQPFFTTKPTGQGTGLGLSLSYDIIKAHGGEIKVETKEGEGAKFIIQLSV